MVEKIMSNINFDKITTNWLITYFVYDNNVYDELVRDKNTGNLPKNYYPMAKQTAALFNQIEDMDYDADIRILIFYLSVRIEKNEESISAIRYEKKLDNLKGQLVWHKKFIRSADIMTSSDSMDSIMNYILYNYNYQRKIFITFGHGSVFGINAFQKEFTSQTTKKYGYVKGYDDNKFVQQNPISNKYFTTNNDFLFTVKTENVTKLSFLEKIKQQLKNFINASTTLIFKTEDYEKELNLRLLSNRELSNTLKTKFMDNKVDVLVMYNCLMQNLYTQYEFSKCVKQFVGASSGIGMPGFNYTEIYKTLQNDKSLTNKEVANLFLSTLKSKDWFEPPFDTEIKNTWFLNRISLDEDVYNKVKIKFDIWVESLLEIILKGSKSEAKEISNIIIKTIRHLYNYSIDSISDIKMFDLPVFLLKFSLNLKGNTILGNKVDEIILNSTALTEAIDQIEQTFLFDKDFFGDSRNEFYTEYDFATKIKGIGFLMPIPKTEYFKKFNLLEKVFGHNKSDLRPVFIESNNFADLLKLIAINT